MDKPYLAIYARHYKIYRDAYKTIDDAIRALQYGADDGQLYGLAVLDISKNKALIPSLTPEDIVREVIGNAEIIGKFETLP